MIDTPELEEAGRETAGASQTIDRAVQLLKVVSASHGAGMALSDLVRVSGLTKPTTRRLLVSLIENGLIEQDDETRRYHLGPETYTLGVLADERYGIQRLAAQTLIRIAEISGDAALLCVQRGTEWVCLAREEGSFPLRSHVLQAGDRHPLGAGAAGLALLAQLSDEEIEAVFSVQGERLQASYPRQSPRALRQQIAETRKNGYSLNAGYVVNGSWGMAVAFTDARGSTHAALTIAGVESRFTESRIQELAVLLKEEKAALEQRLSQAGASQRPSSKPRATSLARPAGRNLIQGDDSHV